VNKGNDHEQLTVDQTVTIVCSNTQLYELLTNMFNSFEADTTTIIVSVSENERN
jgi:hypothetical protein